MDSKQIEKHLVEQRGQLDKTQALLVTAESELEAAQNAFARDKMPLEKLVQSQAKQMALHGSVHKISLNIATLESELATATAAEAHAQGVAELAQIAADASQQLERHLAALKAAHEQIETLAREVILSRGAHGDARLQFLNRLQALLPAVRFYRVADSADNGYAEIAAVRRELESIGAPLAGIDGGLSGGHYIPVFDRAGVVIPQSAFGRALGEAEQTAWMLIQNESRANEVLEPLNLAGETDNNSDYVPDHSGSGAYQVGTPMTVQVMQ